MTPNTTTPSKEIRMRRKDGIEFTGSPVECAERLMKDALNHRLHTGQPYAVWEAEDFCRHFNLEPLQVAKDVGYKGIIL